MNKGRHKLANNFWFDFDNVFRYEPKQDVLEAYGQMGGLNVRLQLFRATREDGTFPEKFIEGLKGEKIQAITFLTEQEEVVFNQYFNGSTDDANMQSAFIEFGQGLLTDERRNLSKYGFNVIHSMDGSASNPPVGYHRWHAVIRCRTVSRMASGSTLIEIWRWLGRSSRY